jgi:GTPase SAR1 family protein
VGNKLDLSRQRAVEVEEAKNYANSVDANFIEVSARTGSGIEDVFIKITSGAYIPFQCQLKFTDAFASNPCFNTVMLDTIRQSTSTIANTSDPMRRTIYPSNNTSVVLSNEPQSAAPITKCC